MKIKFWLLIASGLLVRLILSLMTYHSDMDVFDYAGKLVSEGNILNLYDFTQASAVLNYPPAIYLYHGFFKLIFGGISSGLLLKLPYIIFDILAGLLLFKLSGRKLWVLGLWIFNPVTLYATYMMGQFDIIPVFFILLSLFFAFKNKLSYAALALGFGIAFKLFPVFLLLPLVIFGKNNLERLKLLILGILPYAASIIFYLPSASFRSTALFAGQSSKSLYAVIPVSGGESLMLFPLFLIIYYLFIWAGQKNFVRNDILKLFLIPLLLFFIFTHYHPQWLIWIIPLLILTLGLKNYKSLIPYLLIIFSWFASLFFFDPSLTLGIFYPVGTDPNLTLWSLFNLNPDYNLSRSIIQTVFAAAAFFLIYENLPKKA